MKKIFILLSILFTSGVIINSCIYEKIPEDIVVVGGGEGKPVVCHLSASLSETTLGQDINAKPIGFFLKDSSDRPVQTNNPVLLSNGSTDLPLAEGVDSIGYCYAYYPHTSSSAINNNIYTGTVSASQDQAVSTSQSPSSVPSSIADQLLMVSNNSGEINFNNEIATIQFKNVFSLMRFEIKADEELMNVSSFQNQQIKNFEMYVSNERDTLTPVINLVGQYTIDLSKYPGDPGYTGPEFSNHSAKITANISGSPVINTSTPVIVWIAIPPVTYIVPNYKLVVKMETENANNVSYTTFSTVTGLSEIERNSLISVPIVLHRNNIYSDEAVRESFVDRPANSYVISEPGVYEIAVKKPGGGLLPEADSVDWLWASKAGGGQFEIGELINDISIDSEKSKIKFRVGSQFAIKEGNVVLALKNANKDIVWTWHIWITDEPKDLQYGAKKFLDRNIGALSADTAFSPAIDTYGFVYQWGRKDPIFGGDGLVFDEGRSTLSVARTHTIINKTPGKWNPGVNEWSDTTYRASGEYLKYPMKFVYNENPSEEDDPADWLMVSNTDLWSDAEKTEYDPCPYGYKVPSGYKVSNEPSIRISDVSMLYTAYTNYRIYLSGAIGELPEIWFYNHYNSNRYWIYSSLDGHALWPAAGMREGRHAPGKWTGVQLKYSGTDRDMGKGYYWTSTPLEINGRKVPGASSRICMYRTVLYSETDFGPNADAYPVRCVKYDE